MVSAFQRLREMRATRPSRARGAWWQVPVLALACVLALMAPARQAGAQGVTTGSIGGTVTDASGAPVAGASVIAIHTPSGTNYEATTREDGRYFIPNMRVGGPYVVTVTYVGGASAFEPYTNENVDGQPRRDHRRQRHREEHRRRGIGHRDAIDRHGVQHASARAPRRRCRAT